MTTWGYKIDYAKEIAQDEREVAFYSSDIARAIAAHVEQTGGTERISAVAAIALWPELLAAFGLAPHDVRAMCVACPGLEGYADAFGPEAAGEYARGAALLEASIPATLSPHEMKWGDDSYTFRENGEKGRRDLLKRAKASLARHRRNAGR